MWVGDKEGDLESGRNFRTLLLYTDVNWKHKNVRTTPPHTNIHCSNIILLGEINRSFGPVGESEDCG